MERKGLTPAFALVAAATFLVFLPSLWNGFVVTWDDGPYILENLLIRRLSGETLVAAFTEFRANYWAPFTWISFAIDHALWGLDPFGFHLTNVLLHALD